MIRETEFDFKDQLAFDIRFLQSAFSMLYYADLESLIEKEFRYFCMGMSMYAEMLYKDVEKNFGDIPG